MQVTNLWRVMTLQNLGKQRFHCLFCCTLNTHVLLVLQLFYLHFLFSVALSVCESAFSFLTNNSHWVIDIQHELDGLV